MFDRGLFLSLRGIRRQLAAMPHDLYLVRLIHDATRTAFPGEKLWTAAQLSKESTVRFLRNASPPFFARSYADHLCLRPWAVLDRSAGFEHHYNFV